MPTDEQRFLRRMRDRIGSHPGHESCQDCDERFERGKDYKRLLAIIERERAAFLTSLGMGGEHADDAARRELYGDDKED